MVNPENHEGEEVEDEAAINEAVEHGVEPVTRS